MIFPTVGPRPWSAARCTVSEYVDADGVAVFKFDSAWSSVDRHESYERIIHELGYNTSDVCEIRVTETVVEVDYIDFDDPEWPRLTARHASSAPMNGARAKMT